MFADVHSHLLSNIDDGAKNEKETAHLLKKMSSQGVTHLALTPHYYPFQMSLEDFLKKREDSYKALLSLEEAKEFTFSLGAEVYLTDGVFNNEDLSSLCYEGTSFMLTEIKQAASFTESLRYLLLRLTQDYSITPVLAHIDRYPFLFRNTRLLIRLREMGCMFQINLDAFENFFSRERALHLFNLGLLDFLGEDIHCPGKSREKRKKLLSYLQKRRPEMMKIFCDNAEQLLFLKEK